jgi:hypothetical protein
MIVKEDERRLLFRSFGYTLKEIRGFRILTPVCSLYLSRVSGLGNEFLRNEFLECGLQSVSFNTCPG